jgi:hypothetical protein
LRGLDRAKGLEATVNPLGSMTTLFFAPGPVKD